MSEQCPLVSGKYHDTDRVGVVKVPLTCLTQCSDFWEKVIEDGKGELDWYGTPPEDDCGPGHENKDVEFSHDNVQRLGEDDERLYSTVDTCTGCRQEIMETTYLFTCPYDQPQEQ